jgi:hypothetical protein
MLEGFKKLLRMNELYRARFFGHKFDLTGIPQMNPDLV